MITTTEDALRAARQYIAGEALPRRRDALVLVDAALRELGSAPATGSWIHAGDVQRLARQLDEAMNGAAGAAANPSLCDVVAQAIPLLQGLRSAQAHNLGAPR